MKPTQDESRNGWTAESLRAYQRERDKAFDVVAGNVVTEFKRGKVKPALRIEGPTRYSPFTRSFK